MTLWQNWPTEQRIQVIRLIVARSNIAHATRPVEQSETQEMLRLIQIITDQPGHVIEQHRADILAAIDLKQSNVERNVERWMGNMDRMAAWMSNRMMPMSLALFILLFTFVLARVIIGEISVVAAVLRIGGGLIIVRMMWVLAHKWSREWRGDPVEMLDD